MSSEQIISINEFRTITKEHGFASDAFSDDEVRNYIRLLSGLANINYTFCKKKLEEEGVLE